MLNPDPTQRPTPRALLRHPWLAPGGASDTRVLEPEVVGRLKRFATTSRLKRAAMRVRRGLGAEVGDVRVCGRGGGGRERRCAVKESVAGGGLHAGGGHQHCMYSSAWQQMNHHVWPSAYSHHPATALVPDCAVLCVLPSLRPSPSSPTRC
jgi:hypothetical protein